MVKISNSLDSGAFSNKTKKTKQKKIRNETPCSDKNEFEEVKTEISQFKENDENNEIELDMAENKEIEKFSEKKVAK